MRNRVRSCVGILVHFLFRVYYRTVSRPLGYLSCDSCLTNIDSRHTHTLLLLFGSVGAHCVVFCRAAFGSGMGVDALSLCAVHSVGDGVQFGRINL